MSDATAAGRYTRALFELAEKEGRLSEIDASLHGLAKSLEAQPKVLNLMENPTLTSGEKYGLALSALPARTTGLLERFLRVLIDKKRFALIPDIQKVFHGAFEKKQGVREVELFSAIPFSSEVREKFKAALTRKLRSEIRLIPRTDRGLLGGFILRFDGKEIDCSFKNRLYEIQQKLSGSTEEGIA